MTGQKMSEDMISCSANTKTWDISPYKTPLKAMKESSHETVWENVKYLLDGQTEAFV